MKIRVLGCSGAEFPGHQATAFLIDDSLLLDGGTIGSALTEAEQGHIRHILVTHSHLDHVKAIPLLADNFIFRKPHRNFEIAGIPETLDAIRDHVLNDVIWPDFGILPSPKTPVVNFKELVEGETVEVGRYMVTACRVCHSVPAAGYLVKKGDKSILYTGDTGPTEEIWKIAGRLSALIVEVSYPDEMKELAVRVGHLTPGLLAEQLHKLDYPPKQIFITHVKPQFRAGIEQEIAALGLNKVEILKEGAEYLV